MVKMQNIDKCAECGFDVVEAIAIDDLGEKTHPIVECFNCKTKLRWCKINYGIWLEVQEWDF